MKIKSIIMAAVLATTMTGCAELNTTLSILAEQADAYRNGSSTSSLYEELYYGESEKYCQEYYFCRLGGKGFENFAYRVTEGQDFGNDQEATSFHIGNNVAKLGWLYQKCYEEAIYTKKVLYTNMCDRKYGDKIEAIFRRAGGIRQYDKKIITTDI
jgi:hypothetical protein|nr:MAG TPA: hypothetical protein [Bacteriophage sp.]